MIPTKKKDARGRNTNFVDEAPIRHDQIPDFEPDADGEEFVFRNEIMIQLLDAFASKKATNELGYYLAVTTLDKIGVGKIREHKRNILHGVVHKVLKHGVVLLNVYLSFAKMPDYKYVPGENPIFMNEKMFRIQVDVSVRFVVLATKWIEVEREFRALASLEGDYLGPISEEGSALFLHVYNPVNIYSCI